MGEKQREEEKKLPWFLASNGSIEHNKEISLGPSKKMREIPRLRGEITHNYIAD